MSITSESFGQTRDGEAVTAFILKNINGVKVKVMTCGATIVSIETPDKKGDMADIALGFDDVAGYQSDDNPYFGATCGRYANRIGEGRFTLDDHTYSLATNDGDNSLHGGLVGFDKKVWDAEIVDDVLKMSLVSPDGDEGYPGTLNVEVRFSLSDENELAIVYKANTDKTTVINLTNHSYFNLAGSGTVLNHLAQINADRYTAVSDDAIPTGELPAVAGTEMDLRTPTPIGKSIETVQGLGYDHNYCINQASPGELTLAARVVDPESGRTLECLTTEPGVQFYTGNFLDGFKGKGGASYVKHGGFCLETQHYPDSPNRPEFPSAQLSPTDTYTHTCIYRFGIVA
jgi:aldose 1-epimerase